MVGLVVAMHGHLASALLETAGQVYGPIHAAEAIDVLPSEAPDALAGRLKAAIDRVESGQGVLILVDLLGGTPWNRAVGLMRQRKVEVLAGANLPMLIKFAGVRAGGDLLALARDLAGYGREHMEIASDKLGLAATAEERR